MKNIYQDVTNRIIAELEKGCAPWAKPWSASCGAPVNAVTKRFYSGVNVLLLWMMQEAQGYLHSRWLTFNQARDAGLSVRKGEHGVRVVFVKMRNLKDDCDGDENPKVIHIMRSFVVFNIQQCEGDEDALKKLHHPGLGKPLWEGGNQYKQATHIIERSGVVMVPGSKACYKLTSDEIMMPSLAAFMDKAREGGGSAILRDDFRTPAHDAYFSTVFHEMTHWTAHSTRLDRDLSDRFGDKAYAAEELIAELGSAFLCAHAGIAGQLQHASYIDSWLQLLKSDARAIFTAAAKAQQACDFLLSMQEEQKQAKTA